MKLVHKVAVHGKKLLEWNKKMRVVLNLVDLNTFYENSKWLAMSVGKVLVGWKIIHHHKDVENTFALSGLESED